MKWGKEYLHLISLVREFNQSMYKRLKVTHSPHAPIPKYVTSTHRKDTSVMLADSSFDKACGLVLCSWLQDHLGNARCLKNFEAFRSVSFIYISHLLNIFEFVD